AAEFFKDTQGKVLLDPLAEVFDAELDELDNYAGSKLVLSTDLGPNGDEWFGATNGLLLTPEPGQSFGKVHLSGEEIGKFSQAQARLEIVFTGTVSRAEVNQTLRSLNYTNLDKQARSEATITWEFFDNGTGGNKVSG